MSGNREFRDKLIDTMTAILNERNDPQVKQGLPQISRDDLFKELFGQPRPARIDEEKAQELLNRLENPTSKPSEPQESPSLKDDSLIMGLADPHYQKGVAYRQSKLDFVKQAIRQGLSDDELWYQLSSSGLCDERINQYLRVARKQIQHEDNHKEKT